MHHSLKALVALFLFTFINAVGAAPITYNFATIGRLPGPPPFLPGLGSVTGSFDYDNTVSALGTPAGGSVAGSTIYPGALSAISGSVAGGGTFSDPDGTAIVGDDKFIPPVPVPLPGSDFFLFTLGTQNFSGFSVVDPGLGLLTLTNVRFFWIEGQDGIGDFLSDQSLVDMLPPANPGRLALDFTGANGGGTAFYNVTVTKANVDEPSILLLLGMGLAMMGFISHRRQTK